MSNICLSTTNVYTNNAGRDVYYILEHIAYPALVYGALKSVESSLIKEFLKGCPIDPITTERVFPRKRFVIVAPNTPFAEIDQIVLGFEMQSRIINQPIVVDHYNYYPARRKLEHTHTQTYQLGASVANDPEFIHNFRHTFKSLSGLLGVEQEDIEQFL